MFICIFLSYVYFRLFLLYDDGIRGFGNEFLRNVNEFYLEFFFIW